MSLCLESTKRPVLAMLLVFTSQTTQVPCPTVRLSSSSECLAPDSIPQGTSPSGLAHECSLSPLEKLRPPAHTIALGRAVRPCSWTPVPASSLRLSVSFITQWGQLQRALQPPCRVGKCEASRGEQPVGCGTEAQGWEGGPEGKGHLAGVMEAEA